MIEWSQDWAAAPKNDKTKILILLPDGNITTGMFYWDTETDHESFSSPIAYWSLHDLIRDEPLDESNPVEESEMKWSPFPC